MFDNRRAALRRLVSEHRSGLGKDEDLVAIIAELLDVLDPLCELVDGIRGPVSDASYVLHVFDEVRRKP